MFTSLYTFILSVTDEEGKVVHKEEVRDFLPCYEELLFSAICAGQVANNGKLPPASIEPVWLDGEQEVVAGIRASLPPLSKTYSLQIFADRVAEALKEKELLKEWLEEKKKFAWKVMAQPREEERKRRFSSRISREPYPLVRRPLSDFGIEQAEKAERENETFSLYIAASLLDELREESARSLERERADFLAGHVVQITEGSVALVITGRVPARVEESASKAHFSFSPQTFLEAQKEMAERQDGTTICGWHHNHPPPCGGECLMIVPACKTETVFFSTDDRLVHRTSFPAPYMVALVSGKESEKRADQPGVRAYGWQDSLVKERGFSVF